MPHITYYNYDFEYWQLYHKVTFDGVNKRIIINDNESSLSVQQDIYSAWKEWSQLRTNGKYDPAMRTIGGDPIGEGRFAGDLYFLTNGWQISVPPSLVDIEGAIFNDEPIPVFKIAPGGGVTSVVSQLVQTVETGSTDGTSDTLTQQQVRDAMNLSPTTTAQAGSIDKKLDDLKASSDGNSTTINNIDNTVNNIDATTDDTNTVLKDSVIPTINDIQTNTSNLKIKVDDLADVVNTLLKYQANRTRVDPDAKTLTIYDNDGTTAIRVFDLLDQNGDPSAECIFERVPT